MITYEAIIMRSSSKTSAWRKKIKSWKAFINEKMDKEIKSKTLINKSLIQSE